MEPTQEILENIQNLKNKLIVTYGIDEPLRLVNFDFQDRFRKAQVKFGMAMSCLLYTSPSPRDAESSRMPSSA